jgi:hypothetical protein
MRRILVGALSLVLILSALVAALWLALWAVTAGQDTDEQAAEDLWAVQHRHAAKEAVAEEAAAGRLTLLEAAARFRDLDADLPEEQRRALRLALPAGSDEERSCRQVLYYVEASLRGRPDGPAALGRLKAQLDEALASGDLRLPD